MCDIKYQDKRCGFSFIDNGREAKDYGTGSEQGRYLMPVIF